MWKCSSKSETLLLSTFLTSGINVHFSTSIQQISSNQQHIPISGFPWHMMRRCWILDSCYKSGVRYYFPSTLDLLSTDKSQNQMCEKQGKQNPAWKRKEKVSASLADFPAGKWSDSQETHPIART